MGFIKDSKGDLSFMTWNLYLGVDLMPILNATKDQIPQLVTEVFLQFLQTNFHFRVKAIAREIVSYKPDFIGLQEAIRLQMSVSHLPTVTYDYVELLLNELRNKGLEYEIAAINDNVSIETPITQGHFIQFLDRDVVLIRKGFRGKVINRQEANFKNNLRVHVWGQSIEILRGWSFIDVIMDKQIFRLINTHLDATSASVQVAQGNELLNGPVHTNLPLIVMGDFNSNANKSDTPTYSHFLKAGFKDVWTEVGNGPGYTCCQEPDLKNTVSALSERIDFILYKNGWKPIEADLVGNEPYDRTLYGLWPSDHAGVVASFIIKGK